MPLQSLIYYKHFLACVVATCKRMAGTNVSLFERRQIEICAQLQALLERARVDLARQLGARCSRCESTSEAHCHSLFDFIDTRPLDAPLSPFIPPSVQERLLRLIETRAPGCDVVCLWLWGSRWFFRHVHTLGRFEPVQVVKALGAELALDEVCVHEGCGWDWDFVAVIRPRAGVRYVQEWFGNVLEVDNIDVAVYEQSFFDRELIGPHAPWALQFLLHIFRGGSLVEQWNPLSAETEVWRLIDVEGIKRDQVTEHAEPDDLLPRGWQRPVIMLPFLKTTSLVNGQVNMRHARSFWNVGNIRKAKKRVHYVVQMYNNMAQLARSGALIDPTSSNWHTSAMMGRLFISWDEYERAFEPILESAFMNMRSACNEYRSWEDLFLSRQAASSSLCWPEAGMEFIRSHSVSRFCSVFGLDWQARSIRDDGHDRTTIQFAVSERTPEDSKISLSFHGALVEKCACHGWELRVIFPMAQAEDVKRAIIADEKPEELADADEAQVGVHGAYRATRIRGLRLGKLWALYRPCRSFAWAAIACPVVGCATLRQEVDSESDFWDAMTEAGCTVPSSTSNEDATAAGLTESSAIIAQLTYHTAHHIRIRLFALLDRNSFALPTEPGSWRQHGWQLDGCVDVAELAASPPTGYREWQQYVDDGNMRDECGHRYHELELSGKHFSEDMLSNVVVMRDPLARVLAVVRRARLSSVIGSGGNPEQAAGGALAIRRSVQQILVEYWLAYEFLCSDECLIKSSDSGELQLGRECQEACGGAISSWGILVLDTVRCIDLTCLCIEQMLRVVLATLPPLPDQRAVSATAKEVDQRSGQPALAGLVCQLFREDLPRATHMLRRQAYSSKRKIVWLVELVHRGYSALLPKFESLRSMERQVLT